MRRRVARLDELPDGHGWRVCVDGHEIALFRRGDRVHAVEGICPHRGAALAFGDLRGALVFCPLHAWGFDVETGACPEFPASPSAPTRFTSRAERSKWSYKSRMAAIDYDDRRRMRLDVEFYFAAAHRLPRYDGPCFRVHGHNYRFFVGLEGEVDPRSGMIADFGEVKRIVGEQVLAKVDHRDLNAILENPTAENIARWIWEVLEPALPGLVEVRLYEIPDSCVTYRGPGGR